MYFYDNFVIGGRIMLMLWLCCFTNASLLMTVYKTTGSSTSYNCDTTIDVRNVIQNITVRDDAILGTQQQSCYCLLYSEISSWSEEQLIKFRVQDPSLGYIYSITNSDTRVPREVNIVAAKFRYLYRGSGYPVLYIAFASEQTGETARSMQIERRFLFIPENLEIFLSCHPHGYLDPRQDNPQPIAFPTTTTTSTTTTTTPTTTPTPTTTSTTSNHHISSTTALPVTDISTTTETATKDPTLRKNDNGSAEGYSINVVIGCVAAVVFLVVVVNVLIIVVFRRRICKVKNTQSGYESNQTGTDYHGYDGINMNYSRTNRGIATQQRMSSATTGNDAEYETIDNSGDYWRVVGGPSQVEKPIEDYLTPVVTPKQHGKKTEYEIPQRSAYENVHDVHAVVT